MLSLATTRFLLSWWADLNRRPHPYQGCALPTVPHQQYLNIITSNLNFVNNFLRIFLKTFKRKIQSVKLYLNFSLLRTIYHTLQCRWQMSPYDISRLWWNFLALSLWKNFLLFRTILKLVPCICPPSLQKQLKVYAQKPAAAIRKMVGRFLVWPKGV